MPRALDAARAAVITIAIITDLLPIYYYGIDLIPVAAIIASPNVWRLHSQFFFVILL